MSIQALRANLAHAREEKYEFAIGLRSAEVEAALAEVDAMEARAEAAERKARDLALVIETTPTYAEPRIAAQVVNQLTERVEKDEAHVSRLRAAIESVFQEKQGGVYFSFSAKNGGLYSYRLDEDRAEAVRGILQALKPDTWPAESERECDDK